MMQPSHHEMTNIETDSPRLPPDRYSHQVDLSQQCRSPGGDDDDDDRRRYRSCV